MAELPWNRLQRRLRWFDSGARRQEGEPIRARSAWRKRGGRHVNPWTITLKGDLEMPRSPSVLGFRRWNREGMAKSREAPEMGQ